MHSKLEEIGMTEERLTKLGVGAILYHICPDCHSDIFYSLQFEYYADWKKGREIPMLLYCDGCKKYKPNINPGSGEVLYEKEGEVKTRDNIPFIELFSDLP